MRTYDAQSHQFPNDCYASAQRTQRLHADCRGLNPWAQQFCNERPSDEPGLVEPTRLLEEATRFDPDYSDALALLSQARTWIFQDSQRPEDAVRAKQALDRALAVDSQLPEVQLARGLYSMYVSKDVEQALVDLNAVLRSRPNSSNVHAILGFALRRRGRMTEALHHFVQAWDLDPLNSAYAIGPINTFLGLRRFPEAIDQTKLFMTRFPNEVDGYIARAHLESYLQHSLEPLRALLAAHGGLLGPKYQQIVAVWIAREERRYLDEIKLLDKMPIEDPAGRAALIGFLYWAAGDAAHAQQIFKSVEREARETTKQEPTQADAFIRLALAQSVLSEHAAALASIETARALNPEHSDAVNGPHVSFIRSIVLVRAGRTAEGYAEVSRLLRVPFSGRQEYFEEPDPELVLIDGDPHYDELIHHPPRL